MDTAALVISIIIGVITLFTIFWKGGAIVKSLEIYSKKCNECPIEQVRRDITHLQTQNDIFWTVLQPHLAKTIHSPEHKRRDELVDKLVEGTITDREMMELEPMLCAEANNGVEYKRFPAALLLARVKQLILQQQVHQ